MKLEKLDDFQHIYQHPKFQEEFERLVCERSTSGRYHKWLRKSLLLLDAMGHGALSLPGFEPLGLENKKMISIRYPHSKKNPRVLIAFIEGENVLLLCAFLETSKKTNSDYQAAIAKAKNRFDELVGVN